MMPRDRNIDQHKRNLWTVVSINCKQSEMHRETCVRSKMNVFQSKLYSTHKRVSCRWLSVSWASWLDQQLQLDGKQFLPRSHQLNQSCVCLHYKWVSQQGACWEVGGHKKDLEVAAAVHNGERWKKNSLLAKSLFFLDCIGHICSTT